MSPPAARAAPRRAATAVVHLPPRLELPDAQRLAGELARCRGRPAALDASQVQRMGALALQVLLCARRTWAFDGQSLSVRDPSPQFRDAMALFGAGSFGDPPGE